MISEDIRKRYNDRGAYILAFVIVFFLSMLIGVSIIVGDGVLEPRPAALVMILPAAMVAGLGSRFWIVRRICCSALFF